MPYSNGDDHNFPKALLSLPNWLRGIAVIGIPGAIALYLVWMGGQILPNLQKEILLNRSATEKTQEMLRDHLTNEANSRQETYRLLLRICTNTAKTPMERGQCFDAR